MADDFPTFTVSGKRFLVIPATVAARHGIGSDPAAQRRAKLGRRIRRARVRAGLTQASLASLLGCSQPVVASVESGREAVSDERAAEWIAACEGAR